MTASVWSTIFLLLLPFVCNAANTVLIENPESINTGNNVIRKTEYTTLTNRLSCLLPRNTFTINVDQLPKPVEFNIIALLYKQGNEEILEAFATDSCDEFVRNLYANGNQIEYQISPGKVAKVFGHNSELKGSAVFEQSPWEKRSRSAPATERPGLSQPPSKSSRSPVRRSASLQGTPQVPVKLDSVPRGRIISFQDSTGRSSPPGGRSTSLKTTSQSLESAAKSKL